MPVAQTINTISGWTGRHVIALGYYLVDLTVFIQQAITDKFKQRHRSQHNAHRPLVTQIIFSGVDALPLIILLALAVGVAFTSQMISLTSEFTEQTDIINTLSFLITHEIGPFLTAIVLIGRSGSAMAVDLGNMQLHGEIEGLELLGIDINDYLIAPRLIGAAISQLVLAVLFSGIALYSGVIFAGMLHSTSFLNFLDTILSAQEPMMLLVFTIKNLLFGLVIAGTACFHALRVLNSATEVPQETQRAIVNSLAIIATLDGLLAVAMQ